MGRTGVTFSPCCRNDSVASAIPQRPGERQAADFFSQAASLESGSGYGNLNASHNPRLGLQSSGELGLVREGGRPAEVIGEPLHPRLSLACTDISPPLEYLETLLLTIFMKVFLFFKFY